jgi:dihydropyrimidinase
MEIEAKVDKVLSRGKVVVDGDRYVGSKGDGMYLKRGMSQMLI